MHSYGIEELASLRSKKPQPMLAERFSGATILKRCEILVRLTGWKSLDRNLRRVQK